MNSVIFREYDIRGIYERDFDESFATNLGRAYVSYVRKHLSIEHPTVALGYDARRSSPSLEKALARGIVESGGNVYHLGLVTTPLSYFATFFVSEVQGAIMVTGSHNPPDYNGFKISVGKSTIFGNAIQELRTIIEKKDFISSSTPGKEQNYDIFPKYLKRYQEEFGQITPIKVVLDCGNGAAGCIARRLYEAVGLKPTILFEEPDGRFPNHHPDPTVESNLVALKAKVHEVGAVVGIGFDGDCDRIGVIDSNGKVLPGDEMMAIMSRFILQKQPGQTIVGDVKCSDRLFHYVTKYNGKPLMWKTGHSLIKEKIKEIKAPFGGELSGHIFFADRNYGYDDALYASLRLVEILAQTGKSISELLSDFPPAFNTPEIRIDTTEEKKVSIVTTLKDRYSVNSKEYQVNLIDGIRISYPDGWALVRSSNTQPVLVMRFESSTKEGLRRIQNELESIVQPLL